MGILPKCANRAELQCSRGVKYSANCMQICAIATTRHWVGQAFQPDGTRERRFRQAGKPDLRGLPAMIKVTDNSLVRTCKGLQRREFLRIGALALGGLALPQLLQ